MPKRKIQRPATVVHLGNLGIDARQEVNVRYKANLKTMKYAKRFPSVKFVGIDSGRQIIRGLPKNWTQVKKTFEKGLEELPNNSVSIISSELALGYYDKKSDLGHSSKVTPYTAEVLRLAYDKLRKGGKLMAVVPKPRLDILQNVLKRTAFKKEKITVRPLTEREYERTEYIKILVKKELFRVMFQVIAEK